ncbi:MAG: hypothetical protein KAU14_07485 [Thermoplasmata archaeon]|nr:hypothetical protein [Thermoplasmata archaeon]
MPDKIRENTGLKIVELLKKSNLNLQTNMLTKDADQRLDKILDEAVRQRREDND